MTGQPDRPNLAIARTASALLKAHAAGDLETAKLIIADADAEADPWELAGWALTMLVATLIRHGIDPQAFADRLIKQLVDNEANREEGR